MKIGYVRISTKEQNMARQETIMEALGAERIFSDTVSGKDQNRPQLREMLDYVREGDTLVVESISRFARNTRDLLELVDILNNKKVSFVSQKESIDTSTPSGRFMLTVFAGIAQLEREYMLDRQREGIAEAKKAGKYKGRKPLQLDSFDKIYDDWQAKRITARRAAQLLGVGINTYYRRVRAKESMNNNVKAGD